MTLYPGEIDPLEACENEAVLAIETALGVMPQGAFDTVRARLDYLQDMLISRVFRVLDFPTPQAAIDHAALCGGGFVLFPWGETVVSPDPVTRRCLLLRPGVSLIGHGPQSVIKVADGAGNYVAIVSQDNTQALSDFCVANLTIDGNQAGNAPADIEAFEPEQDNTSHQAGRCAIRFENGRRALIQGIHIRNLDSINHIYCGVFDTEISGCHFEAISTFEHDHSTIYTARPGQRITNNRFEGNGVMRTAIETHGSDQYVRDNTVSGYRIGMNLTGVAKEPEGSVAVSVKDNHLLNVEYGMQLWSLAYGSDTAAQMFADLIIADNVIRLNKTMWPDTAHEKAIRFWLQNNRPISGLVLRDNLVRVVT